jgi:quercetin dioxygenase-like cupin family protein
MGDPTGLPVSPVLREDHPERPIIGRRRAMALAVRRVVTGHDSAGRAIVQIDEVSQNLRSARPGATACVVWTSQGFPIDNTGKADEGLRESGTTLDNGTVFRILELEPGNSPRNHRTDSLDYAVIMSGEIDMELDGVTTHLKAGDVIVQRGTVHNWVNRGTEPCRIAFVLIAAKPVEVGGKVLNAFG